jgi:hypothetical protein
MRPTNLLELQHYDLLKGMEFVAVWIMLVFALVLLLGLRAQYRLMNTYDTIYQLNPSPEKRAQVILAHVKRLIFSVLGYQGEERERQPLDQLDANWMKENLGKIFVRFSVFYFVYIWALILTTRALWIDPITGIVHILSYTSKQLFGFAMIGSYIISNSLFDMLSIYFTLRHLEKIKERPRLSVAGFYLMKNLLYCFLFFLFSQVFSNLIWPLKTNLNIPIADRFFSPAIALWPYAFIVDANASPPQYLHPIFPGQLLITGSVFLPTLVIVLLLAVMVPLLQGLQKLKSFLISQDLVLFGVEVTPIVGQRPTVRFRCLNALTVGVVSGLIATAIWEWLKLIVLSV